MRSSEHEGSTDSASGDGRIHYRKLRAPADHASTLITPSDVPALWHRNGEQVTTINKSSAAFSRLRESAQSELVSLATQYTSRYRNVEASYGPEIVMAGHQPALFHPGVWYKNFVLSSIAATVGATAVNLVVDNDVCAAASIRIPVAGPTPGLTGLEFDEPDNQIPFEQRKIRNRDLFESFDSRLTKAMAGWSDQPLVQDLWPCVLESLDPQERLGHTLAAGRHRLEQDYGLNTLELPVSTLSKTQSFAKFAKLIVEDADRFVLIYNSVLKDYRAVHRIRSRAHPAPELEVKDDWFEMPFWIWSEQDPFRKRLFAKKTADGFQVGDPEGVQVVLDDGDFHEQWTGLGERGIAVRPRALSLTMYSRLVLSQMFMHGIGGSKYDQLTDAIIQRFFEVDPPGYLTVTATLKIPGEYQATYPQPVAHIDQTLRELQFHPETALTDDQRAGVANWIDQKREWVSKDLPRGERRQRHLAIVESNENMQPLLEPRRQQLRETRVELEATKNASRIYGSREFSFSIHPTSLPGELKRLAGMD